MLSRVRHHLCCLRETRVRWHLQRERGLGRAELTDGPGRCAAISPGRTQAMETAKKENEQDPQRKAEG